MTISQGKLPRIEEKRSSHKQEGFIFFRESLPTMMILCQPSVFGCIYPDKNV